MDVHTVVRPADTPIGAIYDALVCTAGCRGDGPAPETVGLFAEGDDIMGEMRQHAAGKLLR
jgi:hypothetical protein